MEFLKDKKSIFSILLSILFLIPILYFPISSDLSIYISEGKLINEGGRIYIDLIDLKPPLFYYFYSLIYFFTGTYEFNIRIFDFIWQFCTILLLLYYIKSTNKPHIYFLSLPIYTLIYVSTGYITTMGTESFIGILMILILLSSNIEKFYMKNLFLGFIFGILISLKFTYFVLIFFYLIYEIYINQNFKLFLKSLIIIAISTATILLISFIPILNKDIFSGFINSMNYLSYYGSLPSINIEFLKNTLKTISIYFGDNFSLVYTFLLMLGIFHLLKKESLNLDKRKDNFLVFLMFTGLFISLMLERKFFVVHFVRLFLIASILISVGIEELTFHGLLKKSNKLIKMILMLILFLAIFFTPFPRLYNVIKPIYLFYHSKEDFNNFYTDTPKHNYRNHFISISNYINKNTTNMDSVILLSIGSNVINHFIDKAYKSKFTQSCFCFNDLNIIDWKKDIINELNNAKYIIAQDNDNFKIITNNDFSSLENLKRNPEYNNILNEKFEIDTIIKPFHIYKRIQPIQNTDK